MNTTKNLLILGYGGHARSIADVALSLGFEHLIFIDNNAKANEDFMGFPVVRECNNLPKEEWLCIPALGDNHQRHSQIIQSLKDGWRLATLIAPSATIGIRTKISLGCFVGNHAHIGPMTKIGIGCIINTGAIVEHECILGDCVHISVNATVAGRVKISDFVFAGASSVVIDRIEVGSNITIGAGGVVTSSLTRSGTYVGVPVKRIENE